MAKFTPLRQYIVKYNTRHSDRDCWTWNPCGLQQYAEQLPEDDGMGFLVQPLICRQLSTRVSGKVQYKLVDGSLTRDRDNVWVDCTVCKYPELYQVRKMASAFQSLVHISFPLKRLFPSHFFGPVAWSVLLIYLHASIFTYVTAPVFRNFSPQIECFCFSRQKLRAITFSRQN